MIFYQFEWLDLLICSWTEETFLLRECWPWLNCSWCQISSNWGECQGNHYRLPLPGERGATVDRHAALPTRLAAHQTQHSSVSLQPAAPSTSLRDAAAFLSEYHSRTCFLSEGGEMRGGISVELFRGGCCTRSEIFTPNIHKAWASVKLWVADINKNGKPPAGLQCLDWTALPPSWDRDLLGIADESHRRWHVDPPRQWIKE